MGEDRLVCPRPPKGRAVFDLQPGHRGLRRGLPAGGRTRWARPGTKQESPRAQESGPCRPLPLSRGTTEGVFFTTTWRRIQGEAWTGPRTSSTGRRTPSASSPWSPVPHDPLQAPAGVDREAARAPPYFNASLDIRPWCHSRRKCALPPEPSSGPTHPPRKCCRSVPHGPNLQTRRDCEGGEPQTARERLASPRLPPSMTAAVCDTSPRGMAALVFQDEN